MRCGGAALYSRAGVGDGEKGCCAPAMPVDCGRDNVNHTRCCRSTYFSTTGLAGAWRWTLNVSIMRARAVSSWHLATITRR